MSRFVPLRTSLFLAFSLCATQALYSQPQSDPCAASATKGQVQQSGQGEQSPSSTKYVTVDEITFGGQLELTPEGLRTTSKHLTEERYEDNPQWLQEIRERVRDAWQHRGYFRAQVSGIEVAERAADKAGRHVSLRIIVDPGRRYYLREIDFISATQFSSAELRAMFPIQDGAIFDTHQLQEGIQNLRKAYGARGYINFSDVPSFEIDEGNNLIKTIMEFDEGKAYRIQKVTILGLSPATTEKLLQFPAWQSGRIFDTSLFDAFFTQNRALLPKDAAPEDNAIRNLNEQQGTVDLVMDFLSCPVVSGR